MRAVQGRGELARSLPRGKLLPRISMGMLCAVLFSCFAAIQMLLVSALWIFIHAPSLPSSFPFPRFRCSNCNT